MGANEMTNPAVYQKNHGWNPKSMFFVIACAAFAIMGGFMWSESPLAGTLAIVLCGGGGTAILIGVLRGNLALRVDNEGITLGTSALRREAPRQTVPWSDIEAVVLYQQVVRYNRIIYVGIRRHDGLEPLPGGPGPRALRIGQAFLPGVPTDTLATSVQVAGWTLDRTRLAQAIELNAPQVPLHDLR
jgi:hypothetical protein